jgi:hypothetical protein
MICSLAEKSGDWRWWVIRGQSVLSKGDKENVRGILGAGRAQVVIDATATSRLASEERCILFDIVT